MIVLEDMETWPIEAFAPVLQYADQIRTEKELQRCYTLEGKSWLAGMDCSRYDALLETLPERLKEHSIKVYHCTRVTDPKAVWNTGLCPAEIEEAKARVISALSQYLGPGEEQEIERLYDLSARRGASMERGRPLCFYTTFEQTTRYDCRTYFDYFGGSLAREALEAKRYKYYPLLRKVGIPCLVACRVKLTDGEVNQIRGLTDYMTDRLVFQGSTGLPYTARMEVAIHTPVLAQDILDVQEISLT
ncbi:hypothetical protein [Pontibacter sp. SGAir0037]|uniref:hypothetical protein n=1 Tax=Pontibacter sp. SGAir0037 TaxID=2571030 RepID=UPI0010F9E239|nr:hypothetical protein [Pontibacter sp. SGAir0037]